MTIDTTFPPASTRSRRPARARRAVVDRRHRYQRIDIRRRRTRLENLPPPVDPSTALAELMRDGDFYEVDRYPYLVVPVSDDLLHALIIAAGATEDDEENGDMEPSIASGPHRYAAGVSAVGDDLELGIDDEPHDEPYQDMEPDSDAEEDDPGGSHMPLGEADIDAQRGRIASRWPESEAGGDGWTRRIPGWSWRGTK